MDKKVTNGSGLKRYDQSRKIGNKSLMFSIIRHGSYATTGHIFVIAQICILCILFIPREKYFRSTDIVCFFGYFVLQIYIDYW